MLRFRHTRILIVATTIIILASMAAPVLADCTAVPNGSGSDYHCTATTEVVNGTSGSDNIINDGTITTYMWGGGGSSNPAQQDTLTNNGTVGSAERDDGLWGSAGNDTIINNGTVNGGPVTVWEGVSGAIFGDDTLGNTDNDTIINNGTVHGNMHGDFSAGGSDTIIINGQVNGGVYGEGQQSVEFGRFGNDTVTLTNNAGVTTIIDGMGGNDTLRFDFSTLDEATYNSLSALINGANPASGSLTFDSQTFTWVNFEFLENSIEWIGGPTPTNTVTFTPTATTAPIDTIFSDGFESGNLGAWSFMTDPGGDLSLSPAAALVGSRGLQVVINDNSALGVGDDLPSAEPRYRARFYFDPNSISMATGNSHIIFMGTSLTAVLFQVELGFTGGSYQVRVALVNDGSNQTISNWFAISDAPHMIEVDWRASSAPAANNGGLTLWLDEVQTVNLSNIDNDTRRIERAYLGAVFGVNPGTRGTYFFDAFESRRQSYIGPAAGAPTNTPTHTLTATNTPTNTATFTPTATFTGEATATNTPTNTATFTPTATNTPTNTVTFTPTATTAPIDTIFSDGFESGNLGAWSFMTDPGGDLSLSPAAALVGSRGLQVVINDNSALGVGDDLPSAEPRYRARFYFDPNSISMATGNSHIIFMGTSLTAVLFQVELGFTGGSYQVRVALVNDGSNQTISNWFAISDAPHMIEVDWRASSAPAANNGGLTLWLDEVQTVNLSNIDNDTRRIERAYLGAVFGVNPGTRGTYFFDAFESRRQSYIGPAAGAPTNTPTHTLTATNTPTNTATFTPTATFTGEVTATNTATFTPTATTAPIDTIFSDGFESGNLGAWSFMTDPGGDLSLSPAAALVGSRGLQVVINDNSALGVGDDLPSAEPRYRARFYFDPNSISMATGNSHIIFMGTSLTAVLFQVELGFTGGSYQVRVALVNDGSNQTISNWFAISDAPHMIEVDWRASSAPAANNGGLTLWLDEVQTVNLSNIDNDTRRIERAYLGAVFGVNPGTRGTYFFDAFESRRQSYIGPAAGALMSGSMGGGALSINTEGQAPSATMEVIVPTATSKATVEIVPSVTMEVIVPTATSTATVEIVPSATTEVIVAPPTSTPAPTETPEPPTATIVVIPAVEEPATLEVPSGG